MNNPFDYTPDTACEKAFKDLMCRIDTLKKHGNPREVAFCRELDEGKMLGVLIAADDSGVRHVLYAFSGQVGEGEFHFPGFVGPVFDYLQPDGYFKTKEAEISRQNQEISVFESVGLKEKASLYKVKRDMADAEIDRFREKIRRCKQERDARRNEGNVSAEDLADMVRQSQFDKAELQRLKKRLRAELAPFEKEFEETKSLLDKMKARRRGNSEELQRWLFSNFRFLNGRGESRDLNEIFASTRFGVPPSGAGECCGPKLLQEAYRNGWRPVSMAEYWYGKPKDGEVRIHGNHYPACRGKCLPILTWMLEGAEVEPPVGRERKDKEVYEPRIVYENQWFCIVDKPSGMLSVPGKGVSESVEDWLRNRYGKERDVRLAHRLDQDTSGLLIAVFGSGMLNLFHAMFRSRSVRKTYVAMLDGDYEELGVAPRGKIKLRISADWLDRPRQKVDLEQGKDAETVYEFLGVEGGMSRILLHPVTGRTHQLRVHAASEQGLGMPIAGDRLYGRDGGATAPRLMLHAHRLEFVFPIDSKKYSFESPVPF